MYGMWAVALMAQAAAAVEGDFIALDDEHLSLMQLRAHKHDTEKQMDAYTEGRLDKAEYDRSGARALLFTSEEAAVAVCDAEEECLGMWLQKGSNKWRTLYAGGRSWAKGVPNGTVLSVKVKSAQAATTTTTTTTEAEVAAVGDPHITTISGDHSDMCCEGGVCKVCPPALLEEGDDAHKHDTEKQMADGCGNAAGGYACTAGVFGLSRVQVLRDLGCRGEPDLWACSVAAAKVACDADATCNSFGVSAKWGLNMAQLFGGADGTPNADWNLWVVAEPEADVAAVGDPHITTISGDHSDMCCEGGVCKVCPPALLEEGDDDHASRRPPSHRHHHRRR